MDEALTSVPDNYDVVIVDCPPQLGFLTMSAMCSATAVLVTVNPQMLDVMSIARFPILDFQFFCASSPKTAAIWVTIGCVIS